MKPTCNKCGEEFVIVLHPRTISRTELWMCPCCKKMKIPNWHKEPEGVRNRNGFK